jgi:hypothetical protein
MVEPDKFQTRAYCMLGKNSPMIVIRIGVVVSFLRLAMMWRWSILKKSVR